MAAAGSARFPWPDGAAAGGPGAARPLEELVGEPEMRTHEGNEWLYVLSGKLRLIFGDRDITINAGEVAEFDAPPPDLRPMLPHPCPPLGMSARRLQNPSEQDFSPARRGQGPWYELDRGPTLKRMRVDCTAGWR